MAVIYCYSGTGNSLYAAKKIAAAVSANVRNMRGIRGVVGSEEDVIGFVFPTYFWGLPKSVGRFIASLQIENKNAYIFAVTTYGGVSFGVCDAVNVLLRKQGVKLSYSAKVKVVENYLPAFECNDSDELWEKSDKTLNKIINEISERKRNSTAPYTVFNGLAQKTYPPNKPGCAEKFKVEGCENCGLCAKVCPNGNITYENGVPKFGNRCDLCLSCLNNCPADAIDYGESTRGKKRYKNRRVSADEIAKLNSQSNELYYSWVEFIIEHKNYFLIWVMDEKDHFITNNGQLVFFENFSNAQRFAKKMGLDISDEIDVYNIDEYVPKDKDSVDCNATLELWNILSDVAASVNVPFEGDDALYTTQYGKLVYGCNLPALSNGYHYDPTWNEEEIADINKILANGIEILYDHLVSKK